MPGGTIKMNKPPPQPIIGPPPKSTKYKGVKHTIMVMSGKGGVGKSTVSVNISVTLAKKFKVGLIDADINGPDDPKMLGVSDAQIEAGDAGIIPVSSKYGVDVISMGFLLPNEDTAVIWRGALRHKAIQQFLEDVAWGERDYIILDMPPGTGDEGLSVAQLVPDADGIIIVVTPQDVALLDARKAMNFATQLKLPVLGIIENMSGFVCPHCGETANIFKTGGGEEAAKKYNVPFLGRIPLVSEVVVSSDNGTPIAVTDNVVAKIFSDITDRIVEIVEKRK
ncbi:MAG: Mrp/NBP35 family ATP-binding protein [Candidatus Thermoplasmatota archaeon]|nr:Mrp/NBP35 family ATP-binding protein [Candidatus Thermoplasmatota archaeon]